MYFFGCLAVFLATISIGNGQLNSGSVLDVLTSTNGLKTFGSWCNEVGQGFYGGSTKITVFAFNDTAYNTMPVVDRNRLQSMTYEQKREYVETYTVLRVVSVNELIEDQVQTSMNGRDLFINKRDIYYWQPGGTSGRTATFVNGAMIVREQIQASNGVIHVLDRPLGLISQKNAYDYMNNPDDSTVQTTLFKQLAERLFSNYFTEAISPISISQKVTMFIPSERALSKIPINKLNQLAGNELSNYFRQHFIPGRVVYTSYIKHQDNFLSGFQSSRIVFLRNGDDVLVRSGDVTAAIERGNITVKNGVIHIIDRMFGYVYNSAREQMAQDAPTFNRLIDLADPRIVSQVTQPSGVNLFVPTDEAFQYIQNLPWINLDGNRTLIDFMLQLHMVTGGSVDVSNLNGDYNVRQRWQTLYNNWRLTIYNDRNDTWANAGNVRARIIRPDVKVTTGKLQYIDAVLGIPSMDIPTLIYYDDWLVYTYNDLKMLGLDTYLKDPRYDPSILPPRSFNGNGDPYNNYGVGNNFQFTQDPYSQQYPNNQYPNNQYPNQYPNNQFQTNNQFQQNQYPTNQYPNNQYPNNQYPNNQYPNNQYPNNQYPNNQYPNNQYPNNQYPSGNQISPYKHCGTYNLPCQFTFFVPNGTAIYNFYLKNMGNRIIQDHPRYRYILRRLIVPNALIFLEQLSPSAISYPYITDSGETITLKKETDNIARLHWGGESARVIMWDLGATNGVVHIIDTVLSDFSDISRDISRASGLLSHNFGFMIFVAVLLSLYFVRR